MPTVQWDWPDVLKWLNTEQFYGIVRVALAAGGPLGAWLITNMHWTVGDLQALTTIIITLLAAIPPIISGALSITAHSDNAKLESAAKLPDVKQIVLNGNSVVAPDANPKIVKVVSADQQ